MRLLLQAGTGEFSFREFRGDEIPPYAILSHTWLTGQEGEEPTYEDLNNGTGKGKLGYEKIQFCGEQARRDGLQYFWVDTCCIDKTSSTELSEAINSMFQWYRDAKVCYTYLFDVPSHVDLHAKNSSFTQSRWFTRGWTLQELLAPREVHFYGIEWAFLGTKKDLCYPIESITGIRSEFLQGQHLLYASIAERMSWASKRRTARTEDVAYCLLGIFGVNMPLLYGEGNRAFIRLQEEIVKISTDQSIFAWGFSLCSIQQLGHVWEDKFDELDLYEGFLAPSPESFSDSQSIIPCHAWISDAPFTMTNKGLRIEIPLVRTASRRVHAILNCHIKDDFQNALAIPLVVVPGTENEFVRYKDGEFSYIPERLIRHTLLKTIYIKKDNMFTTSDDVQRRNGILLRRLPPETLGYFLHAVYPSKDWIPSQNIILAPPPPRQSEEKHLLVFKKERFRDLVVVLDHCSFKRPRSGLIFCDFERSSAESRSFIAQEMPDTLELNGGKVVVSWTKENVFGQIMLIVDIDFHNTTKISAEVIRSICLKALRMDMFSFSISWLLLSYVAGCTILPFALFLPMIIWRLWRKDPFHCGSFLEEQLDPLVEIPKLYDLHSTLSWSIKAKLWLTKWIMKLLNASSILQTSYTHKLLYACHSFSYCFRYSLMIQSQKFDVFTVIIGFVFHLVSLIEWESEWPDPSMYYFLFDTLVLLWRPDIPRKGIVN